MNVAIIGVSGLIGSALEKALLERAHEVRGFARSSDKKHSRWRDLNLAEMKGGEWARQLSDCDVVVNCVGVFASASEEEQRAAHVNLPRNLGIACRENPHLRLIHLSALGVDENSQIPYGRVKGFGDKCLLEEMEQAVVVRPSLVYAPTGKSTRFLCEMAKRPIAFLPNRMGKIQPIHLQDLVRFLVEAVENFRPQTGIVELVGPREISMMEYLACLQKGRGGKPAKIPVPADVLLALGRFAPSEKLKEFLTPDAMELLKNGSVETGRFPVVRGKTDPENFVAAKTGRRGTLEKWRWMSRLSVAVLWAWTALASVWDMPLSQSLAAMLTAHTNSQRMLVILGAVADAVMALLTLAFPGKWLWRLQMGLVAAYTAIIAVADPLWLLHPFGPITKNLIILVLLQGMIWTEKK